MEEERLEKRVRKGGEYKSRANTKGKRISVVDCLGQGDPWCTRRLFRESSNDSWTGRKEKAKDRAGTLRFARDKSGLLLAKNKESSFDALSRPKGSRENTFNFILVDISKLSSGIKKFKHLDVHTRKIKEK